MTVGKMENAALQTKETKETKNEIKFIRGLGRQKVPATSGVPRAELFRGYLAGCQKRERWDGIDRARVMAFAEAELAEVGAGDTATEGHNAELRGATRASVNAKEDGEILKTIDRIEGRTEFPRR